MDEQPQAQAGEVKQPAQEQATDLKELAQTKFGTLSAAESLLLEKVVEGDIAFCSNLDNKGDDPKKADDWTPKRRIRAKLVAWLCTDEQARKQVHVLGIHVDGADITDVLFLPLVNIPFELSLWRCRLKDDISLITGEVSQLNLQGSLVHGIYADGLIVKHSVFLRYGFAASGEVRLLGAQIGGDLECALGTFRALRAERIHVRGSVYLTSGFTANGEVRLAGAQIGGDLDCHAGTFTNKGSYALIADGINVKGGVFLRNGYTASGEVRLLGAQIGGFLECSGATFANANGCALSANGINVKGSVFLQRGENAEGKETPFTAKGEVSLDGSEIDGRLSCVGGVFSNPGGNALSAHRAIVKGPVFLCDRFSAEGRVLFRGAQIGGDFYCEGADFQRATLDLIDASFGTLSDSGLNSLPAGTQADPPTKWPQPGKLLLDGFTYGRISSEGRINVNKRIRWLELQPKSPFRRQPYLHLAKILRDSGDKKEALRVLEKMEDLRRDEESRGFFARVWGFILKLTIGYGYYPKRAIWALVVLIGLGWFVYSRSYPTGIAPTDKVAYEEFKKGKLPAHYPAFSAPIYSLENSLPLVKLGQADKWQPDPSATSPRFVLWFLRSQILLGWLLATFFVAGVSGIVHKE